ncbi:hypothetical protein [Sporomusa acidovorans]|uniref:Uncharacterized protein n=1 Tax=Sporomusa acidovorans (strain ATCC 49682 / DSM 3132 / Mol) TaxID=1123286 RepID=A0ABZ3IYP8_SPOA4|nr:hypothetical protein [Sporomusa acidovorans]OZC16335.1 hypothetical protein SPACI_43210 [Sporomusa acidovorans DSM 3132]SDF73518.1 hypothetical protein SAMN04488499_10749 [Sporomusa acidovorans]
MADTKDTEKAPQTGQTGKEQPAAKSPLPASARKPGQNYSTTKFKK